MSKIRKLANVAFKILTAFMIILILFSNVKQIGPQQTIRNFIFRIRNLNLGYDAKMRMAVGQSFFDYTLFIKENTPEDAVILIPPQVFPWPQTGNSGYIRYFVFPRTVINGNEFDTRINLKGGKVTYSLLLWADDYPIAGKSSAPGWPKFNLKAEYRLYQLPDYSTKKVYGDYNQEEIKDNKGLRGIIKLK